MALSRGSENHAIFSAQPGEPKFHQVPIESVYGRSFGPAVCAGVPHHLLGPDRGLRALRKERRERQVVEDGQIPRRNCAKSSECQFCR
jgi:hypothetical protein